MQAGKLQHRVTIQAATETASPSGAKSQVWNEYATVWAAVVPLSGRELVHAQQAQPDVTHKVTLRSGGTVTRDLITPKHRLLYGSRVLEILSVTDENENGFVLTLSCMESVPG